MEKIIIFENIVYRGNLLKDFYMYCLKRNKNLFKFIWRFIIWRFLRIFKRIDEESYKSKCWGFVENTAEFSKILEEFWKKNKRKIRKKYLNTEDTWISTSPQIIFEKLEHKNVVANMYDIEQKCFVSYKSLQEIYDKISANESVELVDIPRSKIKKIRKGDIHKIFWGEILWAKKSYYWIAKSLESLVKILVIYVVSILVTKMTLYYASILYGGDMYYSYFKVPHTYMLNFLPVFFVMLFFWLLSKRVWVGVLISSSFALGIAWVNYFKLLFRDDVFVFEDLRLVSEGMTMGANYNLALEKEMLAMLMILGTIVLVLFLLSLRKVEYSKIRFMWCFVLVCASVWLVKNVYFNPSYYAETTNEDLINKWFYSDQYVSRGCIYPFIRSAEELMELPPSGYNVEEVEKELSKFQNQDIPNGEKVNVISIMLEAFNDFSEFEGVEFDVNPYEDLHQIEAEAYSGELVTNIFAAGTINTEHLFLSGTIHEMDGRVPENTYVRYFQEQGYTVEGSHPSYEKFYNRVNVNENYGFEQYYFMENKYGLIDDAIAGDDVLLPDILECYEKNKKTGKPYFNFSVTYQNHGPYSSEPADTNYLKWKEGYSDDEYNILNNYFAGIENTCQNLRLMTEYLKNEEEPVILLFFGDHNPWGGDNNTAYEMLDINLNLDEEEGFYNYYDTKYVIWANESAKKILENEFEGVGPSIGPYFLMNELFDLADWTGSAYMQAANKLKDEVEVVHEYYYQENGELSHELSEKARKKLKEHEKIEYYYRKNYLYD